MLCLVGEYLRALLTVGPLTPSFFQRVGFFDGVDTVYGPQIGDVAERGAFVRLQATDK
jgi:hypothetical protein